MDKKILIAIIFAILAAAVVVYVINPKSAAAPEDTHTTLPTTHE